MQRDPLIEEDIIAVPEPKLETSAGGAGLGGPPTAVGTGGDDRDDSAREPFDANAPLWMERFATWWNIPVEALGLSMRAYNCLRRSGILTVGQILERSETELNELRNFGRKSYDELRDRLDEAGILEVPPEPPDLSNEE